MAAETGAKDDVSIFTFVPSGGGPPIKELSGLGYLVAEPEGYYWAPGGGALGPPEATATPLLRFDSNGAAAPVDRAVGRISALFPVLGGGIVATAVDPYRLEAITADGRLAGTYLIGGNLDAFVAGVNIAGHVLVAGPAGARWLDASLAPLGPWFALPRDIGPGECARGQALGDGALVFRCKPDFAWSFRIADQATSLGCVPVWLANHPQANVWALRGGALFGLTPQAPGCGTRVEIFTPSGASCGEIVLPEEVCTLSIGLDGSVLGVTSDPLPPKYGPDDVRTCSWRWWPALLR